MNDLSQYDYQLPSRLIAQHPLAVRSDARMLVVRKASGTIEHSHVRELPSMLTPTDVMVTNNTRVMPARLVGFRTETQGRWQGLFISQDDNGCWHVLSRTRGRLRAGETVTLEDHAARPAAELFMVSQLDDGSWLAKPSSPQSTEELLELVGRVPLPPYIRGGEMGAGDKENYQTVFARVNGSVAAPTAGLHFTPSLLEEIRAGGTTMSEVTLHVGLGTFRPIVSDDIRQHTMHAEWGQVSEETVIAIEQARAEGGRVVAVGTTTTRLLETAAADSQLRAWCGETDIYICPPYEFRAVDAMLTNFHLPRTTLLVMIRTFGGEELIKEAYEEAVRHEYRFYSYGDAMLIVD